MPSGVQPEPGAFARAVVARLRAIMDEEMISVVRLAAAADLSRNYLGKRMRNEAALNLNDVQAICEALDEDLADFILSAIRSMGE